MYRTIVKDETKTAIKHRTALCQFHYHALDCRTQRATLNALCALLSREIHPGI